MVTISDRPQSEGASLSPTVKVRVTAVGLLLAEFRIDPFADLNRQNGAFHLNPSSASNPPGIIVLGQLFRCSLQHLLGQIIGRKSIVDEVAFLIFGIAIPPAKSSTFRYTDYLR